MATAENTEIIERFQEFYQNYYRNEIGELAQNYPDDQRSLYLDWQDLYRFDPDLADDFRTKPEHLREYAEEALRLYDLPVDISLGQAHVRVTNLPDITRIGEVRVEHHGNLVSIPGTVRSSSPIISYPIETAFECQRCGTLNRIPQPTITLDRSLTEPTDCQGCERTGPFRLNHEQSQYIDIRQFRIESNLIDDTTETPESIVARVEDDIVEATQPGDTVRVTGVVTLAGFGDDSPELDATVDDKYIEVSSIEDFEAGDLLDISSSEKQEIRDIANSADPYQQLIDSIAPHVPYNDQIKLAIVLQLFGGVKKQLPDGSIIPGIIHLGIASDPGTFTSEVIDYAARVAPKSVRVNGNDTTQVGLTTAAYKSTGGAKNWELDAGALVLADDGIACLSRVDQLGQDAQAALESVMRDQEVKASKGTATQTLPAETAVLAALQPKYGRFDMYEPIGEQIGLNPELVTQCDLLFTMTDRPDSDGDADLADHVLTANRAGELQARDNHPVADVDTDELSAASDAVAPPIVPDLLRKYIATARRNCVPTLSDAAKDTIEDFYVEMRESAYEEDAPIPVTARRLEALVRLAEASARIRFSDTVTRADAERVTDLVRFSLRTIGVDPETGESDTDVVESGTSKSQRDRIQNIKGIIADIEDEYDEGAPIDVVVERAEEVGINESKAKHEIDKLKQKGEVWVPRIDHLMLT
ncbi:minichromosome maintenance protein MCM [Haloarcula marismortui]|uniref:DNA helicase n=1 Tax=Haloarcula marismortui ATCC 33800 TaxID=662476 RepID=M0JPD5_9EURY|nr:minichromosome maintenance protein MCM [Haloarcula sinaiiensis]EMA10238.1 MCM family protein [Haloarcula sinaiiensis ATCC 33800]QUJ75002.1 minichromosome maintenance protein MCM [Haloarcula sinaiiensis ATCC 33800]